jgi:opacity protein-like surface antigen
MKKVLLSLAVLSSLGFAGGNYAPVVTPIPVVEESQNGFYAGLALSAVSTRDSAVSLDFFNVKSGQDRLGNITFQAGYNYNEYVAFEGRYTTTFSDEDLVKMNGWSLFIKPQYPVSEKFNIYALLGFGGVSLDPVNNSGVNVDDTSFQWGLGLNYEVVDNVFIFADYTSLANDMEGLYYNGALEIDADAITIGLSYQF